MLAQQGPTNMNMTHYMELLANNQPWNLLLFMAIPIVLAETIAVTELYLLYTRNYHGPARALNRVCSILVGFYFAGVFVYLLTTAVVPITADNAWRGIADIVAVGFYLLGVVPLVGLALVDLNIIGKNRDAHGKMGIHASFVAIFLIVGHIAMIFGMMDPAVLGGGIAGNVHHH
ncbi:permease [Rhodopseudomonas palustris HaA2]|uniref:Permease n=1 Tax=Rhodopseudomonas palustris (strain HaA2) TaxID=316058 RepID=Q2IZ02_RHOP2|nr:DUF6803 family protein [Rhodopseudomonas palustris]ABD06558.1 permease [Rhodopseudomonas palustris HaA2]